MMRKLASTELHPMPWKNGGGETIQIAISPPRATVADFDWRVSSARVSSPGPFSPFPGVDRTLAVISGGPLRLLVSGSPSPSRDGPASVLSLDRDSEPYRFAGEWSVDSQPQGDGPVIDFNVMTRRGRCSHSMQRIDMRSRVEVAGALLVLYCVEGVVNCHDVDADWTNVVTLTAGDALHASRDDAAQRVRLSLIAEPGQGARVFVAHIDPRGAADE
jgi:hypothetical protein